MPEPSDTDYTSNGLLTPLEAQVLAQYRLLAKQLTELSLEIQQLTNKRAQSDSQANGGSAHQLSENMRNLEMKIGLIHTLFKGAVYTLFLEQDGSSENK
ncbi:uncharacterized protein CANTADRAFT_47572 [Suhomyces tanzawaensis NRRL Y-17324]|uniref:DASH complex subunit DAD3 n=1 Tax=Suhomyces tanzawaensis NRRL Y-17324 TaxID=984487 RepID=A0A1E4SPC5_9ASCO|nr:uncharacterized protein CANTADRAFT_47572 [Suhomyces tanzawaensis NRRL Y-17324]ODV81267.1 hypothetical protein CANTADRAFT_47572 [Suhomyces tanzawaensis NRRL Y-17324]